MVSKKTNSQLCFWNWNAHEWDGIFVCGILQIITLFKIIDNIEN